MQSSRETVITGVGVVCPIGIGRDSFRDALRAGTSGVGTISQIDARYLPVRIGAELSDFEPKHYVTPRKSLKVMSRDIQVGVAAANLAVEDAGLDCEQVDSDRFGVIYGGQLMYGELHEMVDLFRSCTVSGRFDFDRFGPNFSSQLFPLWMLKYLPNMTASHIGIAHNARGPNNTIVLGDVSGLSSLIEATTLIERGLADVVIAGGTGTRLSLMSLLYRRDIDSSCRNDQPTMASRPFELSRDGMVNGEGAGAFVLEARSHALSRGAKALAHVAGHGNSHVGSRAGWPGMQAAIESSINLALQSSGMSPRDVGHVNAHGLSSREHDIAEAQAIRSTLGDVPVTAVKSFFGNLGAGGGAVELAASVVDLAAGEIPFTLNYEQPDPECPVNVVTDRDMRTARRSVLALNQCGTGQATALLLDAV